MREITRERINNKIGKGHRNTRDHFNAEVFGGIKNQ
jgi:hypothetical protein